MKNLPILFFITFFTINTHASDTNSKIEYNLLLNPLDNIEAMSQNVILLHRSTNNLFEQSFLDNTPENSKLDNTPENPQNAFWDIYWTYLSVVLNHEMGHVIRAKQAGGEMKVPASILIPGNINGELNVPATASKDEEHLANLGGFEANVITTFQMEQSIYSSRKAYTDSLGVYVINKIFYPFYAYILNSGDGSDIETWRQDGDTTNLAIYSYERLGNTLNKDANNQNQLISVPSGLLDLYNETNNKSLLVFLDPLLIWSIINGGSDKKFIEKPPVLNITDNISWMYGIHHAPSLFGYDLYFTQYMKIYDKDLSIYVKNSNLENTNGWGVQLPNIFTTKNLSIGIGYDSWEQFSFGKGSAKSLNIRYKLNRQWGLNMKVSTKNAGYLVGQSLENDTYGYAGLTYRFSE